jgi:hypothetical protein
MSTPTLKSSYKPRQLAPTMGLTRFDYMRPMAFQSTTKFLPGSRWVLGSLLFITDKFGDLSLQELESSEVTRSGISHLRPTLVWVSLVNEAQLRHGSIKPGNAGSNLSGDKADHNPAGLPATIDPSYRSPPESNSEGGREVYTSRPIRYVSVINDNHLVSLMNFKEAKVDWGPYIKIHQQSEFKWSIFED